jgi:hypothetical protein
MNIPKLYKIIVFMLTGLPVLAGAQVVNAAYIKRCYKGTQRLKLIFARAANNLSRLINWFELCPVFGSKG